MLNTPFRAARRAIHAATSDDSPDILRGALAGAAAGLIASLVMDGVEKILSSGGDDKNANPSQDTPPDAPAYTPEAQQQSLMPRGHVSHDSSAEAGQSATEKTATVIAQTVGVELDKPQRQAAGAAVHLGFGIFVGAIYGALAEVMPWVTTGVGIPYGAAVWLLADETALSLLGLEAPPNQRPASDQAGSLGMHLVYGATLDLFRRGIRTLI
jgi:putative membrane protein